MVEVKIPFSAIAQYKNNSFMKLHHASNYGIKMADWCKDQGLIMGKDFEWSVWSEESIISFRFFDKGEKYSSMLALMFGGGDA